MKFKVLGSGAWQGIPAPFCSCDICNLAIDDQTAKDNRMRPQFSCETEEGTFLLEVSPDIRLQSSIFNLPHVTNFVVSHWHFDHMYGLHELHTWVKQQKSPTTIHCSEGTKKVLDKEFGYIPLGVNVIKPFEQFELCGVSITALPVYHMFGEDDDLPGDELKNAYGYLMEHEGKRVAYLGDYYRIPDSVLERIQGVDVLIADGTYLLTDEYKDVRKNHVHGDEIIKLTDSIGAKETYYHSISHLTGKNHEKLQELLPESHFISYDSLEVM